MPDVSADTSPAPRVVVGIDPGTNTGLATVDAVTGAVVSVASAGPLDTVRQLEALAHEGVLAGAYVEDSRDLPVYARHGRANRGQRDRIARSVGQVDGLTNIYVALLESLGVPVQTVEPIRSAKWDAETCSRVTGYSGRSNAHGRDALRIVYGRSVPRPLFTTAGPSGTRSLTTAPTTA